MNNTSPLYRVFRACAEISESESTFRRDLGDQVVRVSSFSSVELQNLLRPHRSLIEASVNFSSREDIESMFDRGSPSEVITTICREMGELLDAMHDDFLTAIINKGNIDTLCSNLGINAPGNLSILPVQRVPRYRILLEAIQKEVEKYNKTNPSASIRADVLGVTLEKVKQFATNVDIAIGVKSFFGADDEMVRVFNKLNIEIPMSIENNATLATEIATMLRKGYAIEKLTKKLKSNGIVADAAKIKQEYYFSRIHESIRDKIREILPNGEIHITNSLSFLGHVLKGYRSTTLYEIDKLNKAFESKDMKEIRLHLEQLGVPLNNLPTEISELTDKVVEHPSVRLGT